MMDRPANYRQLDLLVRAANALEQSGIPPRVRTEVTLLLKLLMTECVTAGAVLPVASGERTMVRLPGG
jgi:hypothetical protein